jgi:hypothetical protein
MHLRACNAIFELFTKDGFKQGVMDICGDAQSINPPDLSMILKQAPILAP